MKSKYVLEVKDEFGFKKQRFYFCSENKIKQILFHEYITLKAKAVQGDGLQRRCSKIHRKGILRDKQFNFFNLKPSQIKTKSVNDTYRVVLNVGFVLKHTISYKKLSADVEYQVVEDNMQERIYHGFYNRTKAIYKASKIARKHLLKTTEDEEDKNTVYKKITKNKIKYSFTYWYRCSYEYDEWDESGVSIIASKINFSKPT